jgi:hypothetical protein
MALTVVAMTLSTAAAVPELSTTQLSNALALPTEARLDLAAVS